MNNQKKSGLSFTISDIKEMSTDKSFERGEELFYIGNVQKITKKGNRFDGIVLGSRPYAVSLINDDEIYFNCTCPYDHGGICKHEVAFALKILDGDYTVIDYTATEMISDDKFDNLYSNITSEKKLLFLKQLLNRDNDLRQQFIAFADEKTGKLDNITGEKIEDIKSQIYNELSNMDFDDLYYQNECNYGYYDNYYDDDLYYNAVETIKECFEPYIDAIIRYIHKGNIIDAIRVLLGIYEGSQNLPDLDSNEIFDEDDYNDNVIDILNEYMRDISNEISIIVKSDKVIKKVISLIFERFKFYENSNVFDEEKIIYDIKDFELLFKSLAINNETALFLYSKIEEHKLISYFSAFIILHIAKITENEKLWIETAESYASIDPIIAKQLLEKYYLKNKIRDFNRIAKIAFNNWRDKFDKYLIDHLDKEQQKDLYIEALKNYVFKKNSLEHYMILRTYLSIEERKVFMNRFNEKFFSKAFYVQLLKVEKRYPDILTCVKENKFSEELEFLIKPILNIYPEQCFNIIIKVNNDAMKSYNRNRRTYQKMVKTLRLLKKIKSKKKETEKYLKSLYNHKPNLPALKDEMLKAKLISA